MRAITLRHHDMPPAALGELQQFSHASETARPLARSAAVVFLLLVALIFLALGTVPAALRNIALALRQDGSLGIALASLLSALCGLVVTLGLVRARHETWRREGRASTRPNQGRRGFAALRDRIAARLGSDREIVSLAGSWPQTLVISLFMAAAGFALSHLWPAHELPPAPLLRQEWFALAAATIVFAFPLLVCRRILGDVPLARLPEAPRLKRLLTVPVAFLLGLAALDIAGGLGLGGLHWLHLVLCFLLAGLVGELSVRPQGLWFLPPPAPREAIAAIDSLLARLLDPQSRSIATLGEALTERFGLDFSRSWALAYVKGALAPFALGMMLVVWTMSGITAINVDERGSYERLGAPTAILKPGLHFLLPWPLGVVRRVEYGVVHSVSIGYGAPESTPAGAPPSAAVAEASVHAEDIPPAGLNRLWDAALPSDVSYLIASRSREAQSFETISAGLRVSYRIGLDDESARRALYRTADAETLVRTTLRRLLAHFLATQTLSDVLVEDRESIANGLQQKLQAALDGFNSGIEIVAVVVEALQPPSGAAAAYHNVQAAEILAKTQVATERGRAQSTASIAQRDAKEMTDKAEADGAELLGEARTQRLQFTADEVAYRVAGPAFLFERYLGNLRTTLKDAGLEIVDHRLAGPDGATFDLRPNLGKPGMAPPIDGVSRAGPAATGVN